MKVTCMVDNAVPTSPFWGEHGLSFLIETKQGRMLFDTGQSGTVLLHNLQVAKVKPVSIDALAISHGHHDHMGGLQALLQHTNKVPLYAHSNLFRERFSRRETKVEKIGPPLQREELLPRVELRLSAEPQEILPGVYTTGEIRLRTEVEGRSTNHMVREGDGWIADPYRDDMSLVLQTTQGLVVVCGCCHAGLLNTLRQVRETFDAPLVAVLGGTHLDSLNEQQLQHVVQSLADYGTPRFYPNHCTGTRAYLSLAIAFGPRVEPCPVGTELTF